LSRSICSLAQFAYLGVEPKTDEAEGAPVGRPIGQQDVEEIKSQDRQYPAREHKLGIGGWRAKPLPQIDPQLVAACKQQNPNFGTARRANPQPSGQSAAKPPGM
jgi:hypothetical protein